MAFKSFYRHATRTVWWLTVLASTFLCRNGGALDISLKSFTCDQQLPIFATDLYLSCNDNPQCTLGQPSDLFGIFTYQDVYDILNGTVYVDAEISLVAYKYYIVSGERLNLCELESQNGNCPADGNYKFDVKFTLPNVDDSWSWFSTGFDHKGELVLYASSRSKVLIGYCELMFNLDVTKYQSRNPPSAFIVGVSVLAISFLGLLVCCCWLDYYKYFFCGQVVSNAEYEEHLEKTNSIKDDDHSIDDAIITRKLHEIAQDAKPNKAPSPEPQDWVKVDNDHRAVSPAMSNNDSLLLPGWISVNDPNTGRMYYANPTTGESSWEPPYADGNADGAVSVAASVPHVLDDAASVGSGRYQQPTLVRNDSHPPPPIDIGSETTTPLRSGAVSPGHNSMSPSRSGWIKVRDPLSGRLYYANPTTGESSWESPFGSIAGSRAMSPQRSPPPRTDLSVSPSRSGGLSAVRSIGSGDSRVDAASVQVAPASPLARLFGAARQSQSPLRSPPSGWIKVKDPGTNREYYANPTTGEVSWQPPR